MGKHSVIYINHRSYKNFSLKGDYYRHQLTSFVDEYLDLRSGKHIKKSAMQMKMPYRTINGTSTSNSILKLFRLRKLRVSWRKSEQYLNHLDLRVLAYVLTSKNRVKFTADVITQCEEK